MHPLITQDISLLREMYGEDAVSYRYGGNNSVHIKGKDGTKIYIYVIR